MQLGCGYGLILDFLEEPKPSIKKKIQTHRRPSPSFH